jgi:hypothetical protein
MSYDPQSGGGTEPTGGETQPTGGQPTQPTSGYTPPPGGDYTPPPPPPPAQPTQPMGGYTPPPGGGYAPPPPPPGGGYGAPPGGYGAPPPPPPPMGGPTGGPSFNMGNMGTVNQATLQDLFQSYMNAVTKPNVSTYEMEIPKASWLRTLVGVAAVAIVSFIVSLAFAGAAAAYLSSLRQQLLDRGYTGPDFTAYAGGGGVGGAIFTLIFTFVWFFLGAGILWLTAKMFGGTNSNFMTHAYLLSISYTPLRLIGAIVGIIPILGGLVAFAAYLYQLYSAGLAMQASQRMQPGRAQLAAFLPLIVGILLFCICIGIFIFVIAAAVNGTR